MNHGYTCPWRAAAPVICARSGDGWAIEQRGSVVDDVLIIFRSADGGRDNRLDDVNGSAGQGTQAHHPAALDSYALSTFRSRRFVRYKNCSFVFAAGLSGMGISDSMVVLMTVVLGVLRQTSGKLMNMNDAQTMPLIGAMCPRSARKRQGGAQREHANEVNQREQSPCPRSICLRMTHEQSVHYSARKSKRAARRLHANTLTANPILGKVLSSAVESSYRCQMSAANFKIAFSRRSLSDAIWTAISFIARSSKSAKMN